MKDTDCEGCIYEEVCRTILGVFGIHKDEYRLANECGKYTTTDKNTPLKLRVTTSTLRCGNCNKQLTNRGCTHSEYKYCRWCGQAIDWSEV
jgi:hypothetical protein